jgi:hypothetical protein
MYLINTNDKSKEGIMLIKFKESNSEWDSDKTIFIGRYQR